MLRAGATDTLLHSSQEDEKGLGEPARSSGRRDWPRKRELMASLSPSQALFEPMTFWRRRC
jgi:hypothetical protein